MARTKRRFKQRIGFTVGEPEQVPVSAGSEVAGHYEEFTDDVAKYEEDKHRRPMEWRGTRTR